jgi:hypothetical protein
MTCLNMSVTVSTAGSELPVSELCLKSFTFKFMAPETWVEYFGLTKK